MIAGSIQRHRDELRRLAIEKMLEDDTDISKDLMKCLGSGKHIDVDDQVRSDKHAAKKCCGGRILSLKDVPHKAGAVCLGLPEKSDCMTRCLTPFGIGCSHLRPKDLESVCDKVSSDEELKCKDKKDGTGSGVCEYDSKKK